MYHYRRRIPGDIRRILKSLDSLPNANGRKQDKREEKKRLGGDLLRAQAAWTEFDRRVEAKWAQLREGPVDQITVVQREALAGDIYRRWLKMFPPEHSFAAQNAELFLAMMEELDGEIPRNLLKRRNRPDHELLESWHGEHVDAVLAERGLIFSPPVRLELIVTAQRAAKHACRYAIKRFQGDLRPDPDADRYPAWPDPKTTTLVGLHELMGEES